MKRAEHVNMLNYLQHVSCISSRQSVCTFLEFRQMSDLSLRDCSLVKMTMFWNRSKHSPARQRFRLQSSVSATDHRDCLFREESLENVTVLTSESPKSKSIGTIIQIYRNRKRCRRVGVHIEPLSHPHGVVYSCTHSASSGSHAIRESTKSDADDIAAISGISCRFPEADQPICVQPLSDT